MDDGAYPTGVKVSDAQMAALPISRHRFHGEWDYTLHPAALAARPPAGNDHERSPAALPPYVPQTAGNTENEIKTAC